MKLRENEEISSCSIIPSAEEYEASLPVSEEEAEFEAKEDKAIDALLQRAESEESDE